MRMAGPMHGGARQIWRIAYHYFARAPCMVGLAMHTERPLCALPLSCRLRPAAFRSTPHRTAQSPLYTPLLWYAIFYAIFYATFVPPRPPLLRPALQEGAEVGEGGAEGVDKEGRRVLPPP